MGLSYKDLLGFTPRESGELVDFLPLPEEPDTYVFDGRKD